jgi:hypothetical protein
MGEVSYLKRQADGGERSRERKRGGETDLIDRTGS